MFGLTRWMAPRGASRLRHEVDDLFDRFFAREDWMPGPMTRSLRAFQRDMDQLFADFFGADWSLRAEGQSTYWPRIESTLKDGEHVIRMELPGFSPEEIEVNVAGSTLTIHGERKGEEKGQTSHRRFSQSLSLPETADPEKVKAPLNHGLLELRMPACPQLVGKKIPVEVGSGEAKKQLKAA
jgi:HSP20 family protein